jgi:D-amino-acid dehydrogenase
LTQKFCDQGGKLVKSRVENIKPLRNDGWSIQIQGQQYKSELLLIASGAWSVDLLKPLGLKLPLVNERGYHLEFKQPGVSLDHSIMDVKSKFVVSSMSGGVRSAGTAEFAHLNARPNYQRAKIFKSLTKRLLPDLNTGNTSEWMGTRPSFPDSLPVIGQVPGFSGLFAAFGHSHYGLGMAPKTGQLLANLVCRETADIDPGPYRLDRFNA